MRKIFVLLAITMVVAMCLTIAASAQAAEMKIAFFNIAEVGPASDAYKAKVGDLQKEFEREGKALETSRDALQKKVRDFQVQQQALTPEARIDREGALNREGRELESKMQSYMQKRQLAERRAEEELHRIIFYAVQQYGKREKYSVIMDQMGSAAIYLDPKLDISKAILVEVNKVWREKPKELFGAK